MDGIKYAMITSFFIAISVLVTGVLTSSPILLFNYLCSTTDSKILVNFYGATTLFLMVFIGVLCLFCIMRIFEADL